MDFWIIIYPSGDHSKMCLAEISAALDYEINHYDLASKRKIYDKNEAIEYGRSLAKQYGREWVDCEPNREILD